MKLKSVHVTVHGHQFEWLIYATDSHKVYKKYGVATTADDAYKTAISCLKLDKLQWFLFYIPASK
jgi:hypothetical protein